MLLGQGFELGDERALAAEGELGVDPRLDAGEAELLEALDVEPCKRLQLEIRQRPAVPESFGRLEHSGGRGRVPGTKRFMPFHDQPLERLKVELARFDPKEIPRWPRDEARLVHAGGAEQLAQAGDVISQCVVGGVHALIGKKLRNEPVP